MSIARKFIIVLGTSILFLSLTNIVAFYIFYSAYLKIYLAEKIKSRDEITIDYINEAIEKQTLDDIDSIFTDTEIEFFELLENSRGKISLLKDKNIDIIVNYLVKSGVAPKYIEEIIPSNHFGKVLESLQNEDSPEYRFINRLLISIIITNILAIILIVLAILVFTQKTILPIKQITEKIRKLKPGKEFSEIKYKQKDEVGLLITAINGLNKRLSLQERIRNRLLADISHELKTPITSIQCYLEGISDGIIKLNDKSLSSITDEMKRLISLVNKIMEYEKFENKKLELDLKNTNINEIVKEVLETYKNSLEENDQKIKIIGDKTIEIKLDKNLFKQIIHNLVGNFLKYAGNKSSLKVNITKNYIDFIDDGDGINSSELQFLTEKFYQGSMERKGDADLRGIGIGLSIVQKIIDSHSWKSEIRSDIDKGFSFKIKI